MNRTILSIILLWSAVALSAQRVTVSPIPQNITWGEKAYDSGSARYSLVGSEESDPFAVELLRHNFSTDGGDITLVIGEVGDETSLPYSDLVPKSTGAYYLSIKSDSVIIIGRDEDGTYYGVRTFMQIASQAEVMEVMIRDFPSCLQRGVIEGFYGNPWTTAARKRQFDFYGANKMNIYVYGPKDDVYHRGQWRTPYPKAQGKVITELAEYARRNHVRFVWAIHPGGDINWTDADFKALITKLENVYSLGVRAFSVFFDDISGTGAAADKQAELLNYVWDNFVEKHEDVSHLSMCPTQYNRSYTSGNYLTTLGSNLNSAIQVMWTGNGVVDMINASDVTFIREKIQRRPFIWLNYPVNDYCIGHLLMGKTYGNDLGNVFGSTLQAFTSNPMEYAEASMVSLYSIADYSWNMKNYDAEASWERAINYLMPTCPDAFRLFCENNVDLGSTAHGLRREGESPTFKAAADSFNGKGVDGWRKDLSSIDLDAVAAMNAEMLRLTEAADVLIADKVNHPEMIEEIAPWVNKMKYMGQRGQIMMAMWADLRSADSLSFLNHYKEIQTIEEKEDAIRSRDFEGSIKKATPVVGEQVITPFLRQQLGLLVQAYKANFKEGHDVFEAVVLENGTYYVLCNGKYLTDVNASPTKTGDYPTFKDGMDDVNPQKCEWEITLDVNTERYKIANVQDGRYINELGAFWRNRTDNPYSPDWHTYTLRRMNGLYAVQNGGSAGTAFWTSDGTRINQGSNKGTVRIDDFMFEFRPVNGAARHPSIDTRMSYYIENASGLVLTDVSKNGTGTPKFMAKDERKKGQQTFSFSKDANGRWKISLASKPSAYINEKGVFGTNQFYSDWNTYVITEVGGMWSIQNAESAGTGFWSVSSSNLITTGKVAQKDSYLFRFTEAETVGEDVVISNDKVYTMTSTRGFLLSVSNRNDICASSGSAFTAPTQSKSDANQLFAILESEGEKYLYSVGADKFVTSSGSLSFAPLSPLRIVDTGNGSYPYQFFIGNNCINIQESKEKVANGVVVNSWTTMDAGNMIALSYGLKPDGLDTAALIERIQKYRNLGRLTVDTRNGNIFLTAGGGALPERFDVGSPFTFALHPVDGYTCDEVVIRWGENLENEYTEDGSKSTITIPAELTSGNLYIKAYWERTDPSADVLVFSDEFDGAGEPAADKWSRTVRQGATWNRWCSDSRQVVYENDGALHCLAIPNPDKSKDNADMLTGGIKSQDKFKFRYGRAEARLRTTQHTGNFPAFWMMPNDSKYGGWPDSGEIDIWETIDNATSSWHTVHSKWTYTLGKGGNSKSLGGMDYDLWHVYRMDWDENSITWYADGMKVWTYHKSTDESQLAQGQWPFDQPFYLILNQSVGNGSWAANADTKFTYETEFDWVRVYQPAQVTGIEDAVNAECGNGDRLYNLNGQMVDDSFRGIVIQNGRKHIR
ncbi:MAG: beta-N-acetylglucosaminidase domain-containing protein [Bacteroidaceae bacterium]|nr:beta-N-acetylglucosaminidase domain-containing protein [Bacteroidaceae bacterium]